MDRRDELIRAGLVLASDLDLPAVLQRIVELAAEITGARYGALGVIEEGRLIDFITTGMTPEERDAIGDLPVGHGILGTLIERGTDRTPIRIADITEDPRRHGFPAHHPEMRSFLGAPIVARGEVFGDIYLTEKQGASEFTEDDAQAVLVLASQAGVAIENARLYKETERLAIMEDRERIAKELHDGVIQALFAVGMGLQGTALMSGDEDLAQRIDGAVGELDRVIRDLRNYIFGLRPGILADRQLGQALRHLTAEFESQTGVITVAEVDEAVASEVTPHAAELIQLAREALSNVGRHAEATTCRLSLRHEDGRAVLEIDDDGKGFETDVAHRGEGLSNLEQRAVGLGGPPGSRARRPREPPCGSSCRSDVGRKGSPLGLGRVGVLDGFRHPSGVK